MSALEQLTLAPAAAAGFHEVPVAEANELLVRWGHYLGACNRPFGQQAWVLAVGARPVSVAVSASAVSAHVRYQRAWTEGEVVHAEWVTRQRGELVELARLCSGEPWATRVMLRLWREVAVPAWPYWPALAAIAYSKNDRHEGRIYRFDGWTKATDRAGSSGGGAWARPRYAGEASHGRKTLWLWECTDWEVAA